MLNKLVLKIQAFIAMRAKIAEAKSLFHKDGERRFIVPFNDGTMDVLTKNEAFALKAEGHLPKDLTAKTIYGACFYFTNTKVKHEKVQSEMPRREFKRRMKSYYNWFILHHGIR